MPGAGLGTWSESGVIPGLGLLGPGIIMRNLGRVGQRQLEEIAHGYTTLTLVSGSSWIGEGRRWPRFGHRVPWDYSGLWVLDGTSGAVVTDADRSVEPPGLYPSPNRPGAMELWTGVVWSGDYRQS